LSHDGERESPVIFGNHSDLRNLFGTFSAPTTRAADGPAISLDLRGGSLLRADGGYLIMYSLEPSPSPAFGGP